ncbi:MAG TPA: YegS/Rv2252/BmrU family lipid kinase [Candidatus Nanopelagicaceae bacterium]|nr:YegS/Rv2252/BmrU family lipid kinase [Candidatus Nanopelagicaceae bacterium]
MKKLSVVINPISGGGRGAQVGARVAELLREAGSLGSIISAKSAEETLVQTRKIVSDGSDGILAVGGDGLVHTVIQALAQTGVGLGVIPAGTGNDFARALGLPLSSPAEIVRRVLSSEPKPVDLGLANQVFFGAILSTGFDSEVNERANSMRWPRGPMRYNIAIARELPVFKPRAYHFVIDGETFNTDAMLVAVANGASYGGGMKICPQADLTDGWLDVLILKPLSKIEFLRVFPRVYAGTHVNHPAVVIRRARSVEIEANAIAYADGEREGPLPTRVTIAEDALLAWNALSDPLSA